MSAFFSQILKGSRLVWVIYAFLFVLSCTVTFSAMSKLALQGSSVSAPFLRHVLLLMLGAAVIVVIQIVDFRIIRSLAFVYMLFAIGLLVYVTGGGGGSANAVANRFTNLGQPSEYVKFGLILLIPELILSVRKRDPFPKLFFYLCMVGVSILLMMIFLENLSSAIIISAIVIVMLLAGGIGAARVFKMVMIALVFAGCVMSVAYIVPENKFVVLVQEHPSLRFVKRAYTWRARLDRHYNNQENVGTDDRIVVTDDNRQEVYAKVAVCRGGWFPSGIGSSLQRNYLPEAFSDYVFAIAAEEGGFMLGILIILAYLSLFVISLYYIIKEQKIYRKLLLLGCAFALTFQAAIHIAVSVGAMPVTGQTLPLVSKGGASIVVVSAMFGLIIKVTATPSSATATFNTEPAPEPTPEPIAEPVDEPAKEPAGETLPEPAEETVEEPRKPCFIIEEQPTSKDNITIVSRPPERDDDDSIFIIEEG